MSLLFRKYLILILICAGTISCKSSDKNKKDISDNQDEQEESDESDDGDESDDEDEPKLNEAEILKLYEEIAAQRPLALQARDEVAAKLKADDKAATIALQQNAEDAALKAEGAVKAAYALNPRILNDEAYLKARKLVGETRGFADQAKQMIASYKPKTKLTDFGLAKEVQEKLSEALKADNPENFQKALEGSGLKALKAQNGCSMSQFIASNGKEEVLKSMIAKGQIDFKEKDADNNNLLHFAAKNSSSVIKAMYEADPASVESLINERSTHGETPLMAAVGTPNETEVIGEFIKIPGVKLDRNSKSYGLMHVVAKKGGKAETFEMLIKKDSRLLDERNLYDHDLPFQTAMKEGRADLVEAFLNADIPDGQKKELLEKRSNVEFGDEKKGENLLGLATAAHDAKMVAKVLAIGKKTGANLYDTNRFGSNPILAAAKNGDADIVRAMIDDNPDALKQKHANNDAYAIHFAAAENRAEVIREICQKEPKCAQFKDREGNTAAHIAAASGHLEALKALYEFEKDIFNQRNNAGVAPIWSCATYKEAKKNDEAVASYLIEHSSAEAISICSGGGDAALHLAVRNNRGGIIRAFADPNFKSKVNLGLQCPKAGDPIRVGVRNFESRNGLKELVLHLSTEQVNVKINGDTPLHSAVLAANYKAIEILQKHVGLDANLTNKDGKTPLNVAMDLKIKSLQKALYREPELRKDNWERQCIYDIRWRRYVRTTRASIVEALCSIKGIDVDFAPKGALTPIQSAAMHYEFDSIPHLAAKTANLLEMHELSPTISANALVKLALARALKKDAAHAASLKITDKQDDKFYVVQHIVEETNNTLEKLRDFLPPEAFSLGILKNSAGEVIRWNGLGQTLPDSKFQWFFSSIQEKLYDLSKPR